MTDLKQLLHAHDLPGFRAAVKADTAAARHPRVVGCAAGLADQKALAILVKAGADLNGMYRNYRPLHGLLQTDPHEAAGKPAPASPVWNGCWPMAPIPN